MPSFYKSYQIHTDKGMHEFKEYLKSVFQENFDLIWQSVCDAPVLKNKRPDIDNCDTLTERILYSEKGIICSPVDNEMYVFHELIICLSNPNFIPVKGPNFFLQKDSKPCTAILIYGDSELTTMSKIKAKLENPTTWFKKFINEFRQTFT